MRRARYTAVPQPAPAARIRAALDPASGAPCVAAGSAGMLAVAFAAALAAPLAAAPAAASPGNRLAPSPGVYRVNPAASELVYEVRHPMHQVRGTTRDVRGELTLSPEPPYLQLPARLTAPLAAFTSRNRNRDANALAVLEATRYPEAAVELRRLKLFPTPGPEWEAKGLAEGEVTLRGVSRPFEAEVFAILNQAGALVVRSKFRVSLGAHAVERPSLFLLPVDDAVAVSCTLVAERGK